MFEQPNFGPWRMREDDSIEECDLEVYRLIAVAEGRKQEKIERFARSSGGWDYREQRPKGRRRDEG